MGSEKNENPNSNNPIINNNQNVVDHDENDAYNAQDDGDDGGGRGIHPFVDDMKLTTNNTPNNIDGIDNNNNKNNECIQVAVRVRPFLQLEKNEGAYKCIETFDDREEQYSYYYEDDEEDEKDSSSDDEKHPHKFRRRRRNNKQNNKEAPPQTIQIGGSTGDYYNNGDSSGLGKTYKFDHVFSERISQTKLYRRCIQNLVDSCLDGYNATCFAYGQTGSGKTYTILGPAHHLHNNTTNGDGSVSGSGSGISEVAVDHSSEDGIIPRAVHDLFQQLLYRKESEGGSSACPSVKYEYEVKIQFLEIYGEQIRDLLSSSSSSSSSLIKIRDISSSTIHNNSSTTNNSASNSVIIDEPEVVGASELTVRDAKDALLYLHKGTLRRVTGATQMNAESSRSHAIFTLIIQQTTHTIQQQQQEQKHSRHKESTATDAATTKTKSVLRSKFHFVDLAGSERQKRTKAEGKRFKEGVQINQGLLVLGNVISALASLSSSDNNNSTTGSNVHVPYRDSKLTRLLRGSLGGNHKTLMIACVSPASTNFEESLNCLRYANRAKNIKNKAVVNIDPTSKLIAALKNKTKLFAGEILRIRELCSDAILTTSTKSSDEEEEKQDSTKNNNTALTTTLIHQILNGGEGSKDITNESLISLLSDGKQAIAGTSTSTPFSSPQKSSKHNNYNNKSSTRTDTSHDVLNSPSIHTSAPSSLISSPFSPSLIQHNKQKEVVEEEKIQLELDLKEAQHEIERLKSSFRQTKLDLINTKEMVFHLEAEKEYYRLQVPHESQDIQLSSTTEEDNNDSTGSATCCDEMTNTLTSPSSSNKQSPDKKKFDEMNVKENDSTDENTPSPHPPPIDQRQDSEEGTTSKDIMQIHKRDFLQKVSSYEKQIANLRHELIVLKQTQQQQQKEVSSAGSKSTTTRKRKPPLFNSPSKPAGAGALSDGEESVENRQIQELTQKYLSRPSSSTTVIKLSSSSDAAAAGTGVSEEQEGVEIEVQHTDMFDDDSSIHEITEATREAEKELDHFLPPAESPLAKKIMEKEDRFTKHKTNLDMHISELASGISAKEELMEQLNASQGKYVTMKEFYQQKLDQMDKLVKSVEEERALMEDELNKVKQNINPTSASPHSNNKNTNTIKNKSASSSKAAADLLSKKVQDLQKSLDEKDKRISHLRRQSQDLSRLTKVSHRNSTNLQRLQSEISDMKKQKVDLQRQVMNERKQHSQEIRILKKNHIMKERQLEKWKHQADLKHQRELQSAKRQASLARTAELMKLRQKYKEAEQKLRKRVVKRGALLKAGVDPALVGYYAKSENTSGSSSNSNSNSSNKNVHTYNHHSSLKGGKKSLVISGRRELNVDKMRSFLSTKVTMVGKLENIAEKVANEWEEHLQLTNRKEELLLSHNNSNNADNEQQQGQDCRESNNIIEEEMEGIDMQIKFKEQRIRQLTSKLSKRPFQSTPPSNSSGTTSSSTSSSTSDGLIDLSFFDDKEFQQISHGISHLQAAQTTCKVLFGMIVRERRKVANLAKTACLLDVKHSDIEKLLQAKTNAFRTHMEDEQVEKNLRENKHREELLEMTTQMREKDKEIELRDAMISDLEILYGPAGPLKLMDHTVDHSNYSTTNKDGDDGTGTGGTGSSSSSFFPKTSPGNTNTNNNNTKMIRRNSSHGYDELELEVKKKEVYRKKEAKVRKMLEDKEQLCRNLEAELAQVKSANKLLLNENRMQELEHANYDDDDDDGEEENDDENVDDESRQQQESGDEENSQFSSNTTQRQLEHNNNMITKGGGDKRSKNNNNRKRTTSRRRRKISKKKRRERHKHIIDMIIESSDDDELFGSFVEQHNTGEQDSHDSTSSSMTRGGGGDPSWANDIMKDLSLIAEGVVPPSLRRLQGGGISFMDNPTKKALSELSRARQVRRSSSSPMNNNNNHNISSNNSVGSSTSSSHHRDSTGAGYQGSTISSSLQQNNQHQRHSTDSYFTPSNDHHHTSSSSSSSKNNEDVFDRLTNPNNYTGVQKKTFSTLPL